MGHSVGEYGALAVAGSLVPSEAVQLLRLRGKSMQAEVDVSMLTPRISLRSSIESNVQNKLKVI